jgi:type VI secretion system secreted protein Hcp
MKIFVITIAVLLGLIVVSTSGSFATASASGSDPIFMKIPGIDGDVVAKGHEKEIQLTAFQFGVSNPVTSSSGGGAGSGKVSISDIAVTKIMDKSSPLLFKNIVTGAHIPQVDIYFVKTGSSGLQTYAHYTLKNVILSSYSVSSGGDIPSESVSINFAQIQFEFTPTNPDGSLGTPITAGWDLSLNKVI